MSQLMQVTIEEVNYFPFVVIKGDIYIALFPVEHYTEQELIDNHLAKQGILMDVCDVDCSIFQAAQHNLSVTTFSDLVDLKQPVTQGITWRHNPDDPLSVLDGDRDVEVLRAVDGPYAENNAAVAAIAKDALAVLIGFYYCIHKQGAVSPEHDHHRGLLDYTLQILRKAGVKNVQDFEYNTEEQ